MGQDVQLEAQRAATVKELLDALERVTSDDGLELIRKLRGELGVRMWPAPVFDVCVEVFGGAMYAVGSRLRVALDRRIGHAQTVWNRKYGPLNPAQEQYLSSVLCGAIRSGEQDCAEVKARGEKAEAMPFVLTKLDKVVNHELVHAGFKKRAGGVDMRAELDRALA
jgi:hypothetical protein